MTMTITIKCDNAAFGDCDTGPEVARILRDLAGRYDGPLTAGEARRKLYDANGNHVGDVTVAD